MLYNKEFLKPRGTSSVVTCCRNRCPITSQNFCVCQKSLYE